ncbi:nucleotidyl transferase AbiEii/AbiGii toxin family protein [Streptomyces sp. NPDC017940]|uniref:nucleotidyl transferase AbiEii/AbiGii toxin family protein n=1 Tax=Streptomyces sp. NPDC017940 TaxID=3365017 RepID=UPI00378B862A
MNLNDLHRRLLADVLAIGTPYPLVITGGYAVQAHGLVDRLSQDLDVATENPAPMDDIVRTVRDGLTQRGWQVRQVRSDPLSGRLVVSDPATGAACEVDILKEAFWAPPTPTEYGPVLALDDVIGTKVRALADRGAVRDLIDVQAASRHHSTADLEALGRRHARFEFSLQDLHDRLTGADWLEDEEFAAYNLSGDQIQELRSWALHWATDIESRLHAAQDPPEHPDSNW